MARIRAPVGRSVVATQVFQARFYASEVFLALQHLHKLGVIYRALPPVGQCLILGHKMGVISPIFLRQVI